LNGLQKYTFYLLIKTINYDILLFNTFEQVP